MCMKGRLYLLPHTSTKDVTAGGRLQLSRVLIIQKITNTNGKIVKIPIIIKKKLYLTSYLVYNGNEDNEGRQFGSNNGNK